jgi:hypothetical protein
MKTISAYQQACNHGQHFRLRISGKRHTAQTGGDGKVDIQSPPNTTSKSLVVIYHRIDSWVEVWQGIFANERGDADYIARRFARLPIIVALASS